MTFYRVKKKFDNHCKNPKIHNGDILVGNELYTEKERKKLKYVSDEAFDIVEIPKNRTYWFFGARFQLDG